VPAGAPHIEAWTNDAGIAATVLAAGRDEADWQRQLSIVDINRDSVFPACPDTQHPCVALDTPIRLQVDSQQDMALLRLSVMRVEGTHAL